MIIRKSDITHRFLWAAMACFSLAAMSQQARTSATAAGLDSAVAQNAACWLDVAFYHQLPSYDDLMLSRGLPPPMERQVSEVAAGKFPPNSGVLIYDYIPAWSRSATYRKDEAVIYRGAAYLSTAPVTQSAAALDPEADAAHWGHGRRCARAEDSAVDSAPLRVWLVSQNGVEAYAALPFSPETLSRALTRFDQSIRRSAVKGTNGDRGFAAADEGVSPLSFDDALAQLSSLVVPADFLHRLPQFQQIIVVPQLGIGEIPFGLLQPAAGSRLVDTTAVWIARSILDVGSSSEYDPIPGGAAWDAASGFTFDSPLVMGNPAFTSDTNLILPQLPGAEGEARAVGRLMNTKPLLGAAATKEAWQSLAPHADVIYLATHGAALPSDPLSGFLALAGAPGEPGRLSALEIQHMNLTSTDLAILSACQTGLGGVHAAGIIGVGRAFTLAGVRYVVMSLWNVDDAATSGLMQSFIREVAACNSKSSCLPAVALKKAMATERKQNPDPRMWGSFTIFGVPTGARLRPKSDAEWRAISLRNSAANE